MLLRATHTKIQQTLASLQRIDSCLFPSHPSSVFIGFGLLHVRVLSLNPTGGAYYKLQTVENIYIHVTYVIYTYIYKINKTNTPFDLCIQPDVHSCTFHWLHPPFMIFWGFFSLPLTHFPASHHCIWKKKIDNNRFNPGKPVKSFFNLEWIKKELVSNRLIELSPTITYVLYLYMYTYPCINMYTCVSVCMVASLPRLSFFFFFIYTHTYIDTFFDGGSLDPTIN